MGCYVVIDIWRCLLHQVLSTTTSTAAAGCTHSCCSLPKPAYIIRRTNWLAAGEQIAARDCFDPTHYCICISVTRSYATPLDYYHQHGVL